MKVGSLVECISVDFVGVEEYIQRGFILPKIKARYTVRTINSDKSGTYIRLEELINEKRQLADGFNEIEFDIDCFRELIPPIANIEEHIKENIIEPQLA